MCFLHQIIQITTSIGFNENFAVRSLYFDDPNYVNYYEKIDGMKLRHKFRLRTYGKTCSQDVPIFLDIPRLTPMRFVFSIFLDNEIQDELDKTLGMIRAGIFPDIRSAYVEFVVSLKI